jgi:hypothetical protein
MIQIEIVEERIAEGKTVLAKGDIVSRPDELAMVYINAGWAKNVATGEIGTRDTSKPVRVDIDTVTQKAYFE